MSKGFGSNHQQPDLFKQQRQQAFANLKQHRDRILGLAWMGYCQERAGAVCFQATGTAGKIDYVPLSQIADREVRQVVEQNDPKMAAVVLYNYGDRYDIFTLSGPHKPPDCYDKLLLQETQQS